MELKRSCSQWVACSQERKWRAEVHVLCALVLFTDWRRKWQPTPRVLPGKSHGQRSLASHNPWGHKESGTTERLTHLHHHQIVEQVSELILLGLIVFLWYDGGMGFLVAQMVKNLPTVQETWVQSLGREDFLEKRMAVHSSILSWRIPWTEEPGGLQSTGSQRVGHD